MFFSKIKSFISIFIITLLVLGLVLSLGVGTDIVSFGMSDKIIAKVNKEEITLEEFNYFRGLRFSELPKEVLSDKDSHGVIIDGPNGPSKKIEVSREKFVELISEFIDATGMKVESCLAKP